MNKSETIPAQTTKNGTAETPTSQNPKEIGGRKSGLDPTRYGDWEKGGKCVDF
jgi:hypothetical protein